MNQDPSKDVPETRDAYKTAPAERTPPVARSRRHWRRLLIVLLAMFVGALALVVLLPTIASMNWARRQVLGMANARVRGSVAVEDWSLGWFSPCNLTGVRVVDTADREVLRVESVRYGGGLWEAITNWDRLSDVVIVEPVSTLYVSEAGEVSLADALSPVASSMEKPKATTESLDITAKIELRGGKVQVLFADGRQAGVSALDAKIDFASAGRLDAKLSAVVDGGGRIQGDAQLRDWMRNGAIDIAAAQGEFHLSADEAIDLEIIDRVAQLGAGLGGTATLKIDGTVADGKLTGDISSVVRGLRAAAAGDRLVEPIDVNLTGKVNFAGDELSTRWDVSGEFGNLNTHLTYKLNSTTTGDIGGDLLAALLAGERRALTLPEVDLQASGRLDLAALAKAIPTLLRVRPGVNITQGAFTIEKLAVKGGATPSINLAATVTGLTARNGDTVIRAEPISVTVDVDSTPERGIEVRRAVVTTGFGEITATGSPEEVSARLTADLAQLHEQVGSMFDFDIDALAGRVAGSIVAKRGASARMSLKLQATVDDVHYAAGGKRLDIARAEVSHVGELTLADGRVTRIDAGSTMLDLDGKVRVDARGWFAPDSSTFDADVKLTQLDVAYLTNVAAGLGMEIAQEAAGVLRGEARVSRADPGAAMAGSCELIGTGITVTERQASAAAGSRLVQPIDLTLAGQWRLAGQALSTEFDLAGEFGEINTQLNYDLSATPAGDIGEELFAALLSGEKRALSLPAMELQASGRVDLVSLTRAVPSLLRVRPGVSISQGELTIDNLTVQGGTSPQVRLSAKLSQLTAHDGERVIRAEPITATIDIATTADGGLQVRRANVKTGFGTLSASGSPDKVTAQLTADLAQLHEQLGSVFDFNVDALAGRVAGTVTAKRDSGDRVSLEVRATATDLRYAAEGRDVQVARGELSHRSVVTLAGGKVSRIEDATVAVDLDGKVKVDAKGWYAPDDATFDADVKLTQVDLAYLSGVAGSSVANSQQMAGTLRGNVKAKRNAPAAPIASSGTLTGQNIAFADGAIMPTALCQWSGAEYSPDALSLRVVSLDVRSDPLELSAKDITGDFSGEGTFAGDVHVVSDLARLGDMLAATGVLEQDPGISGKLNLDSRVRTESGTVSLVGQADIQNFAAPGDASRTPRQVKLAYDARIDTRRNTADVKTFDLVSDIATARLRGTVTDLSGARTVNFDGDYRMVWKDVMPVIYAFAPGLEKQAELRGASAGEFTLTGALASRDDASTLSGLRAQTRAGWDAADLLGVAIGKAQLTPTLRQGWLRIPTSTMSAAGGRVRLGGSVDLTQSPPVLHVPGEMHVLEKVQVTPELAKKLLSRFNPLFGQATKVAGSADLRVRDIALPLGAAIDTGGSGTGVLQLERFQIAPGGVLAELLALGKLAREVYVVDVSGLNFVVRDGRIHYRDLTFSFVEGKFDLMFYGSVGFDDTIDLVVSIPVGETILERIGMSAGAVDYARLLAGLRIDVPMVGTRQNPRLDFSKVDVKSLLARAVRKQGEELITGGGILDILGGGKQNDEDRKATPKRGSSGAKKSGVKSADEADDKPRVRRKSKGSRRKSGRRGDR